MIGQLHLLMLGFHFHLHLLMIVLHIHLRTHIRLEILLLMIGLHFHLRTHISTHISIGLHIVHTMHIILDIWNCGTNISAIAIIPCISTAERPFVDVLQDRRYWLIHLITIPSLFLAGILFMLSGFVFKLFGVVNLTSYLDNDDSALSFSLINDRFCVKNSTNDI